MPLLWHRRIDDHPTNFDLTLMNPGQLNVVKLRELLESIKGERHRGLTLSDQADRQLRAFYDDPTSPLRSTSYALLSNWFTTRGGDRNSKVATRCEALWNAMFLCRPMERLTSPKAGLNHIILADPFARFWTGLIKTQDKEKPMRIEIEGRFDDTFAVQRRSFKGRWKIEIEQRVRLSLSTRYSAALSDRGNWILLSWDDCEIDEGCPYPKIKNYSSLEEMERSGEPNELIQLLLSTEEVIDWDV